VDKKSLKALFISIGLHIVLIAGLVLGDFTGETKPLKKLATPMKPIDAVLVDANKLQKAIDKRNKIKKQKADKKAAEKKHLQKIKKRAEDAKKRRIKEEAKIKRLEKQRKKKAQEKKRADKAAKVKAAKKAKADKIRKQKKQEKQKAEAAAAKARSKRIKEEKAAQAKKAAEAKKIEELKKKKLAEKKRKKLEAKERAIQDEFLAQEMAAEMATRNNARQQQLMSEVERYGALITNIINQHMINDRSTMEGKSCKLKISLASSGFVTNVKTISGDAVVCEAAERAVYKANTLPVSKDPDVFNKMRNIGITVIPEF